MVHGTVDPKPETTAWSQKAWLLPSCDVPTYSQAAAQRAAAFCACMADKLCKLDAAEGGLALS